MRERYPSFTFSHGYGLGVLAVGGSRTADIDWLTALPRAGESRPMSSGSSQRSETCGRSSSRPNARGRRSGLLNEGPQSCGKRHAEAEAQLRAERDAETTRVAQTAHECDLANQRLAELAAQTVPSAS